MWRTLEPVHGMIYFTPHASRAYAALGVAPEAGYFASRAAAMGAVSGEVVVATFYNFNPDFVRPLFPAAWEAASPEQMIEARLGAADAALCEVLGDDVVASDDMAEAAGLAERAARACAPEGRPLYAGHASLAWPDEPHLVLWHAITLLREYRGDGHLAALVLEGVDGCESLVTHGMAGDVPLSILQATRAWPDDAWAAAFARLEARGLVAEGSFTAAGAALRDRIEQRTDEAAAAPWNALSTDEADRLRTLVRPFSKAVMASGVFGGSPR